MEKYSQFRDRGTAIAPFFPVPTPPSSALWTPIHIVFFVVRAALLLCLTVAYFCVIQWLPLGSWFKRCVLWAIIGVPGVWWIDLQVDGVKRGKLHSHQDHLPSPGTIIAASFTSPLDALYLAAIFRPVFTRSYPATKEVEPISLFRAMLMAFSPPTMTPPDRSKLISLAELQKRDKKAIIAVFPECTTTNGRGILPFSPCLLSADPETKIFPVNLRYTPADITTPVPGGYFSWLWTLCSRPTHSMRVRIAEAVYNNRSLDRGVFKNGVSEGEESGFDANIFDSPQVTMKPEGLRWQRSEDEPKNAQAGVLSRWDRKVLDKVGEDLARLGRVKRVDLGVQEKIEFVKVWTKRKR
ncbi:hypothetical protein GQ43DRAFT_411504 [Delitschia confertaspora ATCC 74209]|uniref:Phospholipid/glycerol acyltransferase domain-containing protein n=1 Tax=Delitschia confertaspora ATCC 74209 TaxID=1513339 RepID=A0A9P4MXS2_9PLEO|nr:hypothetical protein GQ43DRAFT_411504 [Delitschia confertaspora ATCC 74209]